MKHGTLHATARRGEALPWSKLTESQVREIRHLDEYRLRQIAELNAELSRPAIARKFGVHVRTIEKVLSYSSWRHVHE